MPYIGSSPPATALTSSDIADSIITEVKMADDAISLAELKAGTDGELITWDASANPVAVAAGTSGHYLKSQGAGSVPVFAAVSAGFTLGSPTATTSGTAITFTSIPAGTKVIHINFYEVSLSGTDDFLVQIGDSGGVETTAYYSYGGRIFDTSAVTGAGGPQTAGALITSSSVGYGTNGTCTLRLVDSSNYIWSMNFQGLNVSSHSGDDTTQYYVINETTKTLSAELDRVNIITDGSNTFDDGKISISYI